MRNFYNEMYGTLRSLIASNKVGPLAVTDTDTADAFEASDFYDSIRVYATGHGLVIARDRYEGESVVYRLEKASEDLPGFVLVASHCSACGRMLTDASSIEFGIGPVCRRKHGYEDAPAIEDPTPATAILETLTEGVVRDAAIEAVQGKDSRKAAKVLNLALAVWRHAKRLNATEDFDVNARIACEALKVLGYGTLAEKVLETFAEPEKTPEVFISEVGGRLSLKTPYNPEFVEAVRDIKGRKWDRESRVWTVPSSQKRAAWKALRAHYEGLVAEGPKGMFIIA